MNYSDEKCVFNKIEKFPWQKQKPLQSSEKSRNVSELIGDK